MRYAETKVSLNNFLGKTTPRVRSKIFEIKCMQELGEWNGKWVAFQSKGARTRGCAPPSPLCWCKSISRADFWKDVQFSSGILIFLVSPHPKMIQSPQNIPYSNVSKQLPRNTVFVPNMSFEKGNTWADESANRFFQAAKEMSETIRST